uniref:Uncharacterized protein n=1 Tax=Globisporangium ultimum (strain ATCC 200006 / CBS 805.95 / DAOM BR144) TaxID=431595 RepID=K3WYG9_GLOUD
MQLLRNGFIFKIAFWNGTLVHAGLDGSQAIGTHTPRIVRDFRPSADQVSRNDFGTKPGDSACVNLRVDSLEKLDQRADSKEIPDLVNASECWVL